jgi:hypothetical protein
MNYQFLPIHPMGECFKIGKIKHIKVSADFSK